MQVDPALDAQFPAIRRSGVTVETGGATHTSELTQAPGEPDDPRWADIIETKFARYAGQLSRDNPLSRLLR